VEGCLDFLVAPCLRGFWLIGPDNRGREQHQSKQQRDSGFDRAGPGCDAARSLYGFQDRSPESSRWQTGARKERFKTQIIMPFVRLMSVWKGTISAANGGAKLTAGPA
jgi:hypothetical protein